jgi:hypothetical protein
MCGHGRCNCGQGRDCRGHGHSCHGGGSSCDCEQETDGCQCGGGESRSCSCGQCGHGEHHHHHDEHSHHGEHAMGFSRRFISRAERIAELEGYLSELRDEIAAGQAYLQDVQAEATAVEERIALLKAA